MEIKLNNEFNSPINFAYLPPTTAELQEIRSLSDICIIENSRYIRLANIYYHNKLKGTRAETFTRRIILERIHRAADYLAPNYGLIIFDAFRTIETQADLFNLICAEVRSLHPRWNQAEIEDEAQKYAAHPYNSKHVAIPTHNTGGAIDLAIYETGSGEICKFGTKFDEVHPATKTDFFEQAFDAKFGFGFSEWQIIQNNRRVLFNLMKTIGFVNYSGEWWHYDLGDCIWASTLGIPWIFESMEAEISTKNKEIFKVTK